MVARVEANATKPAHDNKPSFILPPMQFCANYGRACLQSQGQPGSLVFRAKLPRVCASSPMRLIELAKAIAGIALCDSKEPPNRMSPILRQILTLFCVR